MTTDIKDKIRKILAKAASTNSEGEASVFLAKADALMQKHQLDAFDLGDDSDPVGMTVGATGQSGPSAYRPLVQRHLAMYFGCKTVRMFDTTKKYRIEIVGPESARITTELMTDFVWDQIKAEATKLAAEGHGKRDAMIRQVANAMALRLAALLREKAAANKGARTATAERHALVTTDQVAAWIDSHYSGLRQGKTSKRGATDAARDAAGKISLHRQTTNGGAALRLG